MGLWNRLFGREARTRGPRVRPESVRSILVMADEGVERPAGDPMELVLRVFHARNREMFAAVLQRDLWPQIQLGFGAFPSGERLDPRRLAELVRRSHGDGMTACAQTIAYPLAKGAAPSELTLLTVYAGGRPGGGAEGPEGIAPTPEPIAPLLDLTSPLEGRDR